MDSPCLQECLDSDMPNEFVVENAGEEKSSDWLLTQQKEEGPMKITEYMIELVDRWRRPNPEIPGEEELAPLTPEQARWVAYQAGYRDNGLYSRRVREGAAAMAQAVEEE
jgi:hypothetical protein